MPKPKQRAFPLKSKNVQDRNSWRWSVLEISNVGLISQQANSYTRQINPGSRLASSFGQPGLNMIYPSFKQFGSLRNFANSAHLAIEPCAFARFTFHALHICLASVRRSYRPVLSDWHRPGLGFPAAPATAQLRQRALRVLQQRLVDPRQAPSRLSSRENGNEHQR